MNKINLKDFLELYIENALTYRNFEVLMMLILTLLLSNFSNRKSKKWFYD